MFRKGLLAAVLAFLSVAPSARACLWDYDTLRDEKRGLPGIAEIVAGQWEQHSRFFYQHRVEAMHAKLAAHRDDWDAMDNLAVAHAKLDDLDTAIGVMLDKEKRHPGQYTTASNLGTFYMFKGDLPAEITQLKKALAINPNAHFGREEYQLRLAEYLLEAKSNPVMLDYDFLHVAIPDEQWRGGIARAATRPADAEEAFTEGQDVMINIYRDTRIRATFEQLGLKPNVLDGVAGMLRFGTNQSPDLYYALGDLLAVRNGKSLAYRAYQRALECKHPRPEAVTAAMEAVYGVDMAKASFDPAVIAAERAAAAKWVAEYQQFEDDLIRAGKDTDDEANYASFYATHPRALATSDFFWADYWTKNREEWQLIGMAAGVPVAFFGILILRTLFRRHFGRVE